MGYLVQLRSNIIFLIQNFLFYTKLSFIYWLAFAIIYSFYFQVSIFKTCPALNDSSFILPYSPHTSSSASLLWTNEESYISHFSDWAENSHNLFIFKDFFLGFVCLFLTQIYIFSFIYLKRYLSIFID